MSAARQADFRKYLRLKPQRDRYASVVECVLDRLAERLSSYAEGLDESALAGFDNPENRKQYLLIQAELCDLRRFERDGLGMQFWRVMEKIRRDPRDESMCYGAYYVDSKPDFIYVLLSSKGIDRPTVLQRNSILLRAALTAYNATSGLAIADRDGEGFDIQMRSQFSPGPIDQKLAEEYFANLRISDVAKPRY